MEAICVFTNRAAKRMKEITAIRKGYLIAGIDDLEQIRTNDYVYDGNNEHWTLEIEGQLYSIKRKQ